MVDELDFVLRVALGAGLGALIGFEREITGKEAGLRTHSMVGLGSALFTVLSLESFAPGDPSRVAAQIVSGIGFLGAGAIFRTGPLVKGLTTAAGLWAAAAIGMAAGAGMLAWAGVATIIAFLVLTALRPLDALAGRLRKTVTLEATVSPAEGFLSVRDDLGSIEPEIELVDIAVADGGLVMSFMVDADRAEMLSAALKAMEDVVSVAAHDDGERRRNG